jgi:hypothetical protein
MLAMDTIMPNKQNAKKKIIDIGLAGNRTLDHSHAKGVLYH